MIALLRFIGRRLQNGVLAKHPLVRRLLMAVAFFGWLSRRFPGVTQRVTLRRGETMRVEIIPPGKSD